MKTITSIKTLSVLEALFLAAVSATALATAGASDSWQETMLASRTPNGEPPKTLDEMMFKFPVQMDWMIQDNGLDLTKWLKATDTGNETSMIKRVLLELGDAAKPFQDNLDSLVNGKVPGNDRRWLDLYVNACEKRRAMRLRTLLQIAPKIVFTKHHIIMPAFFAYTEGQSDAQHERHFPVDSALCLLEMNGMYGTVKTLLEDKTGRIRDPAVSYDGKRILFAWKKSLNEDDYHLYEMEAASGNIRQLTSGLGFADFEGTYLPNGDIIFSSTRCVQTVDCWWTEVSNLYTCDKDGKFLRRLGFDQVHTVFPTVMDDGRIIYTRWDYNDRGQVFTQPLFQMNYDGTGQTEFYGNNSWFPTTITQARGIPGTSKVVATLCGHHTPQTGKIAIIDPSKGRQENSGVQLIAPVRETPAVRIDTYGQDGELFMYPYPLNEKEFIVSYSPSGNRDFMNLYYMDIDGKRELLVADRALSCTQAVPLAPRKVPALRPSSVDYRKTTGTYYIKDVYTGPGLKDVPRGTARKLRVVALEFRPAGIGWNTSQGDGGVALSSTPVSIGNGSWDVKIILGDAKIYEDGSAIFTVPAKTPVYFQILDENGCAIQTMRSWSTLQPGETFSCLGCHEAKNSAPISEGQVTMAMKAGAQDLEPFYGPPRGFSFPKEIQPILDRNCVKCHKGESPDLPFSLTSHENIDEQSKRKWSDSYMALTQARKNAGSIAPGDVSFSGWPGRVVNWAGTQSGPEMLPPYSAGAAKSKLIAMLAKGHKKVKLSTEDLEKIAAWIDLYVPYCGDYTEANAWSDDEVKKYNHFMEKRKMMEEQTQRNIDEFIKNKPNQ